MSKKVKPIISFDFRNDYTIKLEKPADMERSFFKDQYQNIMKLIMDHVENMGNFMKMLYSYNLDRNCILDKDNGSNFEQNTNYPNNIFPIMGERGSGKSTYLHNVYNYMLQVDSNKTTFGELDTKPLSKIDWISMGIIDPTLLSKDVCIIEVVVARLFETFRQLVDKDTENIGKQVQIKELYECFKKVQDNLQAINGGHNRYENISTEKLDLLASSTNLKKNLYNLIAAYLKCFTKKGNNQYLIIAIDDFDCNIGRTFELIDEVSKYLVLPNVIIIVTFKLDVMWDSVLSYMISQRKELLERKSNLEKPEDMSSRYIEKLFPNSRWTVLHSLQSTKNHYEIVTENKKSNPEEDNHEDLNKYVVNKIFNKTGIMYRYVEGYLHEIIPINLRELRELITILNGMQDIYSEEDKPSFTVWRKNVKQYKEYIVNDYAPPSLTAEYYALIIEFLNMPIQKKNHRLVTGFDDILFQELSDQKRSGSYDKIEDRLYTSIVKRSNGYENISIGDVLYVLTVCEKYITKTAFDSLLFVIKTLYTIVLTELFIEHCDIEVDKTIKRGKKEIGDLRNNDFEFDDIQKLIGGTFIPIGQHILRNKRNKHRDMFLFQINDDVKITNEALELISFMIIPNKLDDHKYRLEHSRYYDCSFNASTSKYAYFNIYALFFNLFNSCKALENYKFLSKEKNSSDVSSKEILYLSLENSVQYMMVLLPLINIEFVDFMYKLTISDYKDKIEGDHDIICDYARQVKKAIQNWLSNYDKESFMLSKIYKDMENIAVCKFLNDLASFHTNKKLLDSNKTITKSRKKSVDLHVEYVDKFFVLYDKIVDNQISARFAKRNDNHNGESYFEFMEIYYRIQKRVNKQNGTNASSKIDIQRLIKLVDNDEFYDKNTLSELKELLAKLANGDEREHLEIDTQLLESLSNYVE